MKTLLQASSLMLIPGLAVAAMAVAWSAQAQTAAASGADESARPSAAAGAAPLSDGEVRKIDKAQGKVTLRHGPLYNLDMPAMTMVFKVADPKMLESIKEGDRVRFTAERVDGAISLTALQVAK